MTTITVNPGESIQAAINASGSGDIIEVAYGTYQFVLIGQEGDKQLTVGGNDAQGVTHPITLRAQNPNAKPTLMGLDYYSAIEVYRGCTIDGFILKNWAMGISIQPGESNILILNCEIGDTIRGSIEFGISSHHVLIQGCKMYNPAKLYEPAHPELCQTDIRKCYANTVQITGGRNVAGCYPTTNNIIIRNCDFSNNDTHAYIDMHACTSDILIDYCNFYSTTQTPIFMHDSAPPSDLPTDGYKGDIHYNTCIRNCWFEGGFGLIELDCAQGAKILNNDFVYASSYAVELLGTTKCPPKDVYFYGNTYRNIAGITCPDECNINKKCPPNGCIYGNMPVFDDPCIPGDPNPPSTCGQDTGSLDVSSTPSGAEIFIDNIDQNSVTRSVIHGIVVGTHTLKLTKAGYDDFTKQITIVKDQTTVENITLIPTSQGITLSINLIRGWNQISVPLNLSTWELGQESVVGNPLSVNPTNSLTSIYRYNTSTSSYEVSNHFDDWGWYPASGSESFTRLEPGIGYWVVAKNDCVLTFSGTEPSALSTNLVSGWNIIGWYSLNEAILGQESVVGNPLSVNPTNSLTSIYRYDPRPLTYVHSDHFDNWGWYPEMKLEPGKGYWVSAKNNCVLTTSPLPSPISEPPIGYWKFDEESDFVAVDSSGNNHRGVKWNTTRVSGKTGFGSALSFNGSNSLVYFYDPYSRSFFNITNEITISALIKVENLPYSGGVVISRGDSSSDHVWLVSIENGYVVFYWANGYTFGIDNIVRGTKQINDGQWHSIVARATSSTIEVYVDGVLDASKNKVGNPSSNTNIQMLIGNLSGYDAYFNGVIDEVKIYKKAIPM